MEGQPENRLADGMETIQPDAGAEGKPKLLEQIRQLLRTRRYSIHAASSVTRRSQPSRAQAAAFQSIREPPLASRRSNVSRHRNRFREAFPAIPDPEFPA